VIKTGRAAAADMFTATSAGRRRGQAGCLGADGVAAGRLAGLSHEQPAQLEQALLNASSQGRLHRLRKILAQLRSRRFPTFVRLVRTAGVGFA